MNPDTFRTEEVYGFPCSGLLSLVNLMNLVNLMIQIQELLGRGERIRFYIFRKLGGHPSSTGCGPCWRSGIQRFPGASVDIGNCLGIPLELLTSNFAK